METLTPDTPAAIALGACIFDVDGVLLASPHEQAWREALQGFANPVRFTTALYQTQVAGKPRAAGAVAALEALGVHDAAAKAGAYAARKQAVLEELVRHGGVHAYPDALRFVDAVAALGWPMAAASSSKNANDMMRPLHLPSGRNLLDVFAVNVCGRDLARGKPDPEMFLLAAAELHVPAAQCVVIEDAPAGIEAAVAGHMSGLGLARLKDAPSLRAAGATFVVTTLDHVDLEALAAGRLAGRAA